MKAPSVKFDTAAIGSFLLAHGEKIAVGIVSLVGLLLAWGGIDAVRVRSVSSDRRPEVIVREATQAEDNIGREKAVPADMVVAAASLTAELEPWRSARPQEPPTLALLDRPLFDAASKRTQPDILPVEDLRVTAGVAVLRQQPVAGADIGFPGGDPTMAMVPGAAPPGFPGAGEQPGAAAPRRGRNRRDQAQQPTSEAMMAGSPNAGMMAMPMPVERVRVVPYTIVTGLIPAKKQLDEYLRRFASASFQDPRRDTPLWSDFEIDRTVVEADGQDNWEPLDLQQVVAKQMAEWPGLAQDVVPPLFMLGPDEERRIVRSTPLPFCGPLPQRTDTAWGDEVQHPWVKRKVQELLDKQAAAVKAAATAAQEQGPVDVFQGQGGGFGMPDYGSGAMAGSGMMPGSGMPGMMSGPGMMMDSAAMGSGMGGGVSPNAMAMRPEYRLFRFVDTTVEPGKRYRYRVRLKAWNPNWSPNPEQMRPHVADFAVTKEQKLASPDSAASSAVRVPETTSLMLATLPDAERKRLRMKPGMFEILVMAITEKTGNFTLRSVLTDVGGLANVDSKSNKPGDQRSRGEDVLTDMLLVDIVGDQGDPNETAAPGARRPKSPAEPLEMLFVREDGSFELVSAADSQPMFIKYRQTLPDAEDSRRAAPVQPGGEMMPGGSPSLVSPFGQVSP
jgi:hypothetical protein